MTMFCITNDMPEVRSCVRQDMHYASCDGKAYRWNAYRNREETTGKPCKGCVPHEAKHGLLCWGCWDRVQSAFAAWRPFEDAIEGVDRAVQRDNGGVRTTQVGYVPIPGLLLALDEVRSYLRSMTGSADEWVATVVGAKDAVRFARAVSAAVKSHPVAEQAHKLHRLRCPKCGRLSFLWHPPEREGGMITVRCQNTDCGKTIHELETTVWGEEKIAIVATIETREKTA